MLTARERFYLIIQEATNKEAIVTMGYEGLIIGSRKINIVLIEENPYSIFFVATDNKDNVYTSEVYDWSEVPSIEEVIADFDYYMM